MLTDSGVDMYRSSFARQLTWIFNQYRLSWIKSEWQNAEWTKPVPAWGYNSYVTIAVNHSTPSILAMWKIFFFQSLKIKPEHPVTSGDLVKMIDDVMKTRERKLPHLTCWDFLLHKKQQMDFSSVCWTLAQQFLNSLLCRSWVTEKSQNITSH